MCTIISLPFICQWTFRLFPCPAAAAAAKSLQSCPTLCDPRDGSHQAPPSWDSPGRNTGVGCHFLLQCMKVKSESEVAQSCPTLSDPMDCSLPGSSIHGIFQARVLDWGASPSYCKKCCHEHGSVHLFQLCFFQGIHPVVGLLGHMVVLFLVFSGISILFFIVAVSIYILTNSYCSLLHHGAES